MNHHDHCDDHHHADHLRHEQVGRGPHDVGGLAAGRTHNHEHVYDDWERRVDSIRLVLAGRYGGPKIIVVDELRGNIEALADSYWKLGYYERWIVGISKILLAKGIITTEELAAKVAEIEAAHARQHD
jgi:hypothetical protein